MIVKNEFVRYTLNLSDVLRSSLEVLSTNNPKDSTVVIFGGWGVRVDDLVPFGRNLNDRIIRRAGEGGVTIFAENYLIPRPQFNNLTELREWHTGNARCVLEEVGCDVDTRLVVPYSKGGISVIDALKVEGQRNGPRDFLAMVQTPMQTHTSPWELNRNFLSEGLDASKRISTIPPLLRYSHGLWDGIVNKGVEPVLNALSDARLICEGVKLTSFPDMLAFHSCDDRLFPYPRAVQFLSQIGRSADVVQLPNGHGHLWPLSAPVQTAEIVLDNMRRRFADINL